MAIKAGQIIHAGNGTVVIDRIQSAGPGQLNIPTEKLYELGNYQSVGTVRDVPDLSFSLESYDVSTEVEALLSGTAPERVVGDADITAAATTLTSATAAFTAADVGAQVVISGAGTGGADLVTFIDTVTNATTVELEDAAVTTVTDADLIVAQVIDLATAIPIDIMSQFKAGVTASDETAVIGSVAVPFLTCESMSYRFGIRDNAMQSASLRGDSVFYNPGACLVQTAAGTDTEDQTVVTTEPAYQVAGGDERRVLAVTVGNSRLTFGADYSESYGAPSNGAAVTTVTIFEPVPVTETIRIIYSTPTVVQYDQNVHASAVVKPAAIKGKNVEVYIGGYDPNDPASSLPNKLKSVQSLTADWRVTLEKDEELGNAYAVGQDFDVPTVSGGVDVKPRDPDELLSLIRTTQGVTDAQKVLGTQSTVPVVLDVVLKHPDTDEVLKRLHLDDARFTPPGYTGRVQTKMTVNLPFESDGGALKIYRR